MYLLDTNIVVFLLKNKVEVVNRIRETGLKNCYISEITIAELKYGATKSPRAEHHHKILSEFLSTIQVIPIIDLLDDYAVERVRLEKLGIRIDDFDLLIGITAVVNRFTMITNNVKHLGRIKNIKIEDWSLS